MTISCKFELLLSFWTTLKWIWPRPIGSTLLIGSPPAPSQRIKKWVMNNERSCAHTCDRGRYILFGKWPTVSPNPQHQASRPERSNRKCGQETAVADILPLLLQVHPGYSTLGSADTIFICESLMVFRERWPMVCAVMIYVRWVWIGQSSARW